MFLKSLYITAILIATSSGFGYDDVDINTILSPNAIQEPFTAEDMDFRLNNDEISPPEGHVCMNKVMMVEETKYEEELRCNHVYTKSCYQTYTTVFKPAPVEECKDTFKKSCFYEYKKVPHQHTVEICNDNPRRDCERTDGQEICTKEFITVCETLFNDDAAVEDDVPVCKTVTEEVCKTAQNGRQICRNVPRQECRVATQPNQKLAKSTECKKIPRTVCGPEACPVVQGERVCRKEIKTVVQEVPEETCDMTPRKQCSKSTQIIPSLESSEECVDVPKEICETVKVNPQVIKTPVVKKWCGPADIINRPPGRPGGRPDRPGGRPSRPGGRPGPPIRPLRPQDLLDLSQPPNNDNEDEEGQEIIEPGTARGSPSSLAEAVGGPFWQHGQTKPAYPPSNLGLKNKDKKVGNRGKGRQTLS